MTSRKLKYFNDNGYSEFIRYMLHYGKVDFEDIRYDSKDWPVKSVQDSLPYGQLPVYEENGRSIDQSFAIGRYVASFVGLLPSDPWEQSKLDAAALNVYDMIQKLAALSEGTAPGKQEESKKKMDEILEFYLSRNEKALKAGNGHFDGKLTWADFVLVGMIETINLYLKNAVEKNYPTIKALMAKIHSLPGVKEYLATRPHYTV